MPQMDSDERQEYNSLNENVEYVWKVPLYLCRMAIEYSGVLIGIKQFVAKQCSKKLELTQEEMVMLSEFPEELFVLYKCTKIC
jgi:hypothetical protein